MPSRPKKQIINTDLTLNDLFERITDIRDLAAGLDKKLDLHIQKTEFELRALQESVSEQNVILQEHHDRSTQLKRDNELREEALRLEIQKVSHRVDRLEFLVKVLEFLKKHAIWMIGIGTAVAVAWGKIKALF